MTKNKERLNKASTTLATILDYLGLNATVKGEEKNGKMVYRPPGAIDLSGLNAEGQEGIDHPMGSCIEGQYPYYSCEMGSVFGDSCSPGTTPDDSHCDAGAIHTDPACQFGSRATTRCWNGSNQNI